MVGNSRKRSWLFIAGAMALAAPWLNLRMAGFHGQPVTTVLLTGLAILGAAFLLSWAAEVVQLDISQGLAVALLSLVAVLPEYSVDIFFAWRAGQDPIYGQYALANMTGGNRLPIGAGWSLLVILYWWKTRRSGRRMRFAKRAKRDLSQRSRIRPSTSIELQSHERLELSILILATLYAFVIPIKGTLSLFDAAVLIGIFVYYIVATSRQKAEEPDLVGPAQTIGALRPAIRRLLTIGMAGYATIAILLAAEPFAEGLVESGRLLMIDEFLLVQWLAPLASESPEFIVAALFVLNSRPQLGLRTLLSSKVNQWTLLVGTLPVAYAISSGGLAPLILDQRQIWEVLLTVAQSIFAVALLAGLRFPLWGGVALFALFAAQLLFPSLRTPFVGVYIVLALGCLMFDRSRRLGLLNMLRSLVPFGQAAAVIEPKTSLDG